MATKAAELYDEDFYAWTQQQAQALAHAFQGGQPPRRRASGRGGRGPGQVRAARDRELCRERHRAPPEARLLRVGRGAESLAGRGRCVPGAASSARSRRGSANRSRPSSKRLYDRARRAAAAARCISASPTSCGGFRSAAPTIGTRSGIATCSPRRGLISGSSTETDRRRSAGRIRHAQTGARGPPGQEQIDDIETKRGA